jgi:hypothetical protein
LAIILLSEDLIGLGELLLGSVADGLEESGVVDWEVGEIEDIQGEQVGLCVRGKVKGRRKKRHEPKGSPLNHPWGGNRNPNRKPEPP